VGVEVDLLEAMDEPGGMLRYGIPAFRLPRDILKSEIDSVIRLGVNLRTNVRVGERITLEDILSDYDAALLTAGCYKAIRLGVPGEDMDGVHSGLEFVMDVSSGKAPKLGERVLVIGAGFTAFDCARLALRYGAKSAAICVRATEEDIRVTKDEIHEAKLEGVEIRTLMTTKRIKGSKGVEGVEFLRTRLGERRPNGKRATHPIEGSEFITEADSILVAIGQAPVAIPGPAQTGRGDLFESDQDTFRTSNSKLYMAGDYMTGPSTVIEAIAAGRKAAQRIAEDLTGKKFREWVVRIEESSITDRHRSWDFIPRQEIPTIMPAPDRLKDPQAEVELGYPHELAFEESKRCYLCYLHYEIDISRCIYCRYCIDVAPRDCIKLVKEVLTNDVGAIEGFVETDLWRDVNAVVIDNSRCIRCGECLRVCPVDCISVSKVELAQRVNQREKGS
jgi:formate dehydrogenase major subunit